MHAADTLRSSPMFSSNSNLLCLPCVQQLMWVQACNRAACEVAHAVHTTLVAAHVALNQTRDDVICTRMHIAWLVQSS